MAYKRLSSCSEVLGVKAMAPMLFSLKETICKGRSRFLLGLEGEGKVREKAWDKVSHS